MSVALASQLQSSFDSTAPPGPLLPSRYAKIVQCGRAFFVMAAVSAFILAPTTRALLQSTVLVPIAAVISIQSSLGATIVTAWRIVVAAVLSSLYTCAVIAIFSPNIFVAIAFSTIGAFFVSYLELSPTCKRFSLAGVVVTLLQWWDPGRGISFTYAIDVGLSLIIGAAFGTAAALVPLPVVNTASHEAASRLRLLFFSLRDQFVSLTVIFTHRNEPASGTADSEGVSSTPSDTSADFREGEWDLMPLMRADNEDSGASSAIQIEMLAHALSEMRDEPLAWGSAARAIVTPCASCRVFDEATLQNDQARFIHDTFVGFHGRLSVWGSTSRKLQRILHAMAAAERQISASDVHELYRARMEDPACELAMRVQRLHDLALAWSSRLRWHCCARARRRGHPYGVVLESRWFCLGYLHEPMPLVADIDAARHAVNAALASFMSSFRDTRVLLRTAALLVPSQAAGSGSSRSHAADLFSINSFLFNMLRYTQIIVSTADVVCPREQPILGASVGPGASAARVAQSIGGSCFTAPRRLSSACARFLASIGFTLSQRQARRAVRIATSILLASTVGLVLQEFVFTEGGYGFWGSVTIAFITGGGEDVATFSVVTLRIIGTLVGAGAALVIVRLSQGSDVAVGALITVFVATMQYFRVQGARGYWALVAAFSSAIIAFGSSGLVSNADNLLELRVLYTLLGILIYVIVTFLFWKVSARALIHRSMLLALHTARRAQADTVRELVVFIDSEADRIRPRAFEHRVGAAGAEMVSTGSLDASVTKEIEAGDTTAASESPIDEGLSIGADAADGVHHGGGAPAAAALPLAPPAAAATAIALGAPPSQAQQQRRARATGGILSPGRMASLEAAVSGGGADPTHPLDAVDAAVAALSGLDTEALAEPAWGPPFHRLHPHYIALGAQLTSIAGSVRSLHQCLLSLRAQSHIFTSRAQGIYYHHQSGRGGGGGGRQRPDPQWPAGANANEPPASPPDLTVQNRALAGSGLPLHVLHPHPPPPLHAPPPLRPPPEFFPLQPHQLQQQRAEGPPLADHHDSDQGALAFRSLLSPLTALARAADRVYALSAMVLADDAEVLAMAAAEEEDAAAGAAAGGAGAAAIASSSHGAAGEAAGGAGAAAPTFAAASPVARAAAAAAPSAALSPFDLRLRCTLLLPVAVDAMKALARAYLRAFDGFLVREQQQQQQDPSVVAAPYLPLARGTAQVEAASATPPAPPAPLLLSNVDALCYTTASFALQRIAAAAAEAALLSRRLFRVQHRKNGWAY